MPMGIFLALEAFKDRLQEGSYPMKGQRLREGLGVIWHPGVRTDVPGHDVR